VRVRDESVEMAVFRLIEKDCFSMDLTLTAEVDARSARQPHCIFYGYYHANPYLRSRLEFLGTLK